MVDREQIHKAIDELSPKSLEKVGEFIELLSVKEEQNDQTWFGKLYDLFAPVRQGVLEAGMTEEEVNQILDEALAEVRRDRKA